MRLHTYERRTLDAPLQETFPWCMLQNLKRIGTECPHGPFLSEQGAHQSHQRKEEDEPPLGNIHKNKIPLSATGPGLEKDRQQGAYSAWIAVGLYKKKVDVVAGIQVVEQLAHEHIGPTNGLWTTLSYTAANDQKTVTAALISHQTRSLILIPDLTTRAGTPTTTDPDGTSSSTTALGPTITSSPMVTGPRIRQPDPR